MTDNGILSRIPGEHIGAATQALPEPTAHMLDSAEVVREVPGFGRVKFTMRKLKTKRGRSTTYFWSATKAELLGEGELPVEQ